MPHLATQSRLTGSYLCRGLQDLPLEQLGDVKTDSIASWVATENVRRTISREFRNFLVTYVDEQGVSVYGQRIKTLGEGEHALLC